MDEETGKVEAMPTFNVEQLEHMKKNHTLEIPAGMFDKAVSKTTERGKTTIKALKYKGFELSAKFPQNICLMRDGRVVFCDKFEKPQDSEKPLIYGYEFKMVRNDYIHIYHIFGDNKILHRSSLRFFPFYIQYYTMNYIVTMYY